MVAVRERGDPSSSPPHTDHTRAVKDKAQFRLVRSIIKEADFKATELEL